MVDERKGGEMMTRSELIKALEDGGAEFKGYKRAKVEELQDVVGCTFDQAMERIEQNIENSEEPEQAQKQVPERLRKRAKNQEHGGDRITLLSSLYRAGYARSAQPGFGNIGKI